MRVVHIEPEPLHVLPYTAAAPGGGTRTRALPLLRGVYSQVARGQIPGALRIGRSIRFDPRVIAQWLSANKASAGGLP